MKQKVTKTALSLSVAALTAMLCPTLTAMATTPTAQAEATQQMKRVDASFNTVTVFDKYKAQYRIPAIVQCKSGKVIAFADHRYDNRDIGGGRHLDIVMKESNDMGVTWTDNEKIVARGGIGGANSFDCAHGDAAVVVDRKTGEILLMCASGGIGYWESTRENPQKMGRYYSNDEGKTWTVKEVTADVYGLMDDMTSAFFTSGRICQSKYIKAGSHYRLYSVLTTHKGNRVLYSDDFGTTWKVLGENADMTAPKGDEAKIEELPDGNVLISSRTRIGRFFNIYKYDNKKKATGKWLDVALSSAECNGVDGSKSACNGEAIIVKGKDKKGKKTWLLLQSVPTGHDRSNVTMFYKVLRSPADYATPQAIAKNWDGRCQLSTTTSAYSTMVQAANGDILFLYEENAFHRPPTEPDDYYDIIFKNLSLKELTGGDYE